jgi:hypothetical protein
MELAGKLGTYGTIAEFCRRHNDLLGYGTALAHQRQVSGE